jgi:DNA-binding XRE family transcriptional regulator
VKARRTPSWDASGLVERAWKRLDPPTQEKLAELLEIKRTNLSKLNKGTMWMTLDYAERIAAVVPEISVADLGAPSSVVAEADLSNAPRSSPKSSQAIPRSAGALSHRLRVRRSS